MSSGPNSGLSGNLQLTVCVIFDKVLHFSGPQSHYLENGNNNYASLKLK